MKYIVLILTLFLLFTACSDDDKDNQEEIDYKLVAKGTLDGEQTDFTFRYREDIDGSPWNSFAVMGDSLIANLTESADFVIFGFKMGYTSSLDYDTIAVTDEEPIKRLTFEFEVQ